MFGPPESAIPQPADRGILLEDILEDKAPERYYLKDEVVRKLLEHRRRNKENGNNFGAKFHRGGGENGHGDSKGKRNV